MMSTKDMSDRLEIQDLLARYCQAIDSRNFDDLDHIFTSDAHIDYTEAGGAKGTLAEIKTYLVGALKGFSGMQHMIGLPLITLEGDSAKARTALYNPMITEQDGQPHVFFVGMWYVDELIRTEVGWRISNRREEASYFHNLPEAFKAIVDTK